MDMKKISNIIAAAAVLLGAVSCEIDLDKTQILADSAATAPVLLDISDISVDQSNVDEGLTFAWSEASFGAPAAIDYYLHAVYGEKDAVIGKTNATSLSMTKADLNGSLVNTLGVKANDKAEINAYVQATVADSPLEGVTSNSVTFSVQTFKAKLNYLYICGQFQNGWDVANAPQFWETGGGTKEYKILIDYLAGGTITPGEDQGFKILTLREWSGDYWGYDGITPSWECPENNDKNFQFGSAAKEIYMLTVNLGDKTISAEGIDALSLIGDFDESASWANDVDLVYDCNENIWTAGPVTFSGGSTDFLIRYNHDWSKKLGTATKASDDIEGGFELEEGGNNMKVPGDGTYIMKIHGNRTPMVIVMEKQ